VGTRSRVRNAAPAHHPIAPTIAEGLPDPALQTDLVLAYARSQAAERQGRWADGRSAMLARLQFIAAAVLVMNVVGGDRQTVAAAPSNTLVF